MLEKKKRELNNKSQVNQLLNNIPLEIILRGRRLGSIAPSSPKHSPYNKRIDSSLC